jgi:hypothetical protein
MDRISTAEDIQAELQKLMGYVANTKNPSRSLIARELRDLAVRTTVSFSTQANRSRKNPKRFSEYTDEEFQAAALKCGESNWKAFKEQCFLSEEEADEIIQREEDLWRKYKIRA